MNSIVNETINAVDNGFVEITLLGQNVNSYSTKDDVMKDFTLLSNKGFKAYIRDSVIDDKVVYTLNIGPNINEETVKSIKKEVQALLNVSPKVQYYRD